MSETIQQDNNTTNEIKTNEIKKSFTCIRCGLISNSKAGIKAHISRAVLCEAKIADISREECFKQILNETYIPKPEKPIRMEIKSNPNPIVNQNTNIPSIKPQQNNIPITSNNITSTKPQQNNISNSTILNSPDGITTKTTFNPENYVKTTTITSNNPTNTQVKLQNNNGITTHNNINRIRNVTKNNNYMLYNATGRLLDQNDINKIVDSIVQNEMSILNSGGKLLNEDSDDEPEPCDDSCNCKLCHELTVNPYEGSNKYFADEIIEINKKLQINKNYHGYN